MHRFYSDLATWWPLISPPDDYAEEAAEIGELLAGAGDVLELGSGGGHNAFHLKERFELTLVDLAEGMLEVSRALNPACEHHQGDMRTVRLGRTFDAVLIHDAIDYMCTEDDLRQALATAFVHCRPGGLLVLVPDHTAETFEESTDHGGNDAPDGRGVRYLEWTWDPDPGDTSSTTEYTFVFREADGEIWTVHESHHTGLFGRQTWLDLLAETGFEASAVTEDTAEDREPREIFLGRRPR